jgi:hypothetical protein
LLYPQLVFAVVVWREVQTDAAHIEALQAVREESLPVPIEDIHGDRRVKAGAENQHIVRYSIPREMNVVMPQHAIVFWITCPQDICRRNHVAKNRFRRDIVIVNRNVTLL